MLIWNSHQIIARVCLTTGENFMHKILQDLGDSKSQRGSMWNSISIKYIKIVSIEIRRARAQKGCQRSFTNSFLNRGILLDHDQNSGHRVVPILILGTSSRGDTWVYITIINTVICVVSIVTLMCWSVLNHVNCVGTTGNFFYRVNPHCTFGKNTGLRATIHISQVLQNLCMKFSPVV